MIKALKILGMAFFLIGLLMLFNVDIEPVFAQPQGGGDPQGGFENPLGSKNSTVSGVIVNIIQWILGISAFLAMLSLIIGGVRLIISFGNDQGVAAAKKNIQWAIIGIIVILLSFAIISIVSNALGVS